MNSTENISENEVRHRNVDRIPLDFRQAGIMLDDVETTGYSLNLFWNIVIASLVSSVILLILRRLFFF